MSANCLLYFPSPSEHPRATTKTYHILFNNKPWMLCLSNSIFLSLSQFNSVGVKC